MHYTAYASLLASLQEARNLFPPARHSFFLNNLESILLNISQASEAAKTPINTPIKCFKHAGSFYCRNKQDFINNGNSISHQINVSNLTTDFYQLQIFSGT